MSGVLLVIGNAIASQVKGPAVMNLLPGPWSLKRQLLLQLLKLVWMPERIKILWLFDSQALLAGLKLAAQEGWIIKKEPDKS